MIAETRTSDLLPRWMEEYSALPDVAESFSIGTPMSIAGPHEGKLALRADDATGIRVTEKETACHIACIGKSGSGKSRWVLGFAQDTFLAGHGGTIFDNNGMLPHDFIAWAAKQYQETGDRQFIERIHVFDPSPELVHSEQPLLCPPEYRDDVAFDWWRQTQCDDFLETILRAVTPEEREIMKRLFRHSGNFFRLIATPDDDGQQLSPADVYIMMNVYDPDHGMLFEHFKHRLPRSDRNDFEHLHNLRAKNRDQVIDGLLESTQNMVSRAIDTVMESIYSRPDVPSVPYEKIITEKHWAIFVGRPNQLRSKRSMTNVTDLSFRQIRLTAAKLTEEGRQELHYVIMDEPGNSSLAGPELGATYELCRATGISLVTLWQGRTTFVVGDHDLFYSVINNSDLVVCAQQKLPDPEIVRYFRLPCSQLGERVQEVDRPDPSRDEIVTMQNGSRSAGKGGSHSVSRGESLGVSSGENVGFSIVNSRSSAKTAMRVRAVSEGETNSWNHSHGSGESTGQGDSLGLGRSFNTITLDGQMIQVPTASESSGSVSSAGSSSFQSEGEGSGKSKSASLAVGESNASGVGLAIGKMFSQMLSRSKSTSLTETTSKSWMESLSNGWSQTLVQRTRVDHQATGSPQYDLTYQDAIIEYLLAVIPPRYMLCRGRFDGREQTILLRSKDVPDSFDDQAERQEVVNAYLKELYATKDYLFTPEPAEVARKKRLERFRPVKNVKLDDKNPDNDHFNFG